MIASLHRFCGLACLCVLGIGAMSPAAAGAITYISSERYILVSGLPRVDAVGFSDFNQSLENFTIPFPGGRTAFRRASQLSTLRTDRILLQLFAETSMPNSSGGTSGASIFRVRFQVDVATVFRLDTGPLSSVNVADAGVGLHNIDSNQSVFNLNQPLTNPLHGVLQPGTYSLGATASAGSQRTVAGRAEASISFVVPAPGPLIGSLIGFSLVSIHRRRTL